MPEAKRIPLELRQMRKRADRTRSELADDLGLSVMLVGKLENGHGNPRLSTIFQLCSVLAKYLELTPRVVFDELLSDDLYDEFTKIRVRAIGKLEVAEEHPSSFKAKHKFLEEVLSSEGETSLRHVSYDKFQKLYATSQFSQVELVCLTGLSERRLSQIFGVSAGRSGNMSLGVFLRLAAALSPVFGAGIKETTFYLVGGELEKLRQSHEGDLRFRN